MPKPLNVALIGTKFMGRAHSNAWMKVNSFFDLPRQVRRHTACGRNHDETPAFAEQWGWANSSTNWKHMLADDDIHLVDVSTPNDLHADQAIAALEAGKHVACEKPLAGTLDDAREMLKAAKKAMKKNVKTFVWFNYRRCPAVALAHQMVQKGCLGRIYHVRACYLQDWGGPETPLFWRFQGKHAGSGAHGDLNAHIIDLARFVTGDEINEVVGSIEETFIKQRMLPEDIGKKRPRLRRSTVDDAVLFLARFKQGAIASFEATRLATGSKNRNTFEINGEHGSIRFNLERMNELEYFDAQGESSTAGWRTILATESEFHPYIAAWWPPGHIIGYEHSFINQAADIVNMIAGRKSVVPMPDFADAFETQRVLEAAIRSAREKRNVKMTEVR